MDVAGQHDGAGGAAAGEGVEQAAAGGGVAVPLVDVHRPADLEVGHHDLLRDHDPPRGSTVARRRQASGEPLFLVRAQHRPRLVVDGRAAGHEAVTTGLVAAELPGVEHEEPGEIAPLHDAVEALRRPPGVGASEPADAPTMPGTHRRGARSATSPSA